MSHPVAFSCAYLLATCFCVFYFYFVSLYRANTYRPVLLHCLKKHVSVTQPLFKI
nr:MAG TPA: hypothetical protein [Bacteriophage sp.]